MNVLVTGGTGFVGRELLRELRAAGHAVRLLAHSRESARVREIALCSGAEIHAGNVLDAASLAGGLRGADAVVHLVGYRQPAGDWP